jgi:hypothetical protein
MDYMPVSDLIGIADTEIRNTVKTICFPPIFALINFVAEKAWLNIYELNYRPHGVQSDLLLG